MSNAPLVGGVSRSILSDAGLLMADASALNDVSTSNGHTLRLVGGYADGLQTVFLIEIDDQSLATAGPPSKADRYLVTGDATLTDQFGHTYQRGGTPSGDARPVVFGPLVSPAAENGARLTLHVGNLSNVGISQSVDGDWKLHATLFEHRAHTVPLPAPVSLAGNTYTVTSIRTSTVIEIDWKVTGPNVARVLADYAALRHLGRAAQDPFLLQLVGLNVGAVQEGYSFDPPGDDLHGHLKATLDAPGTCQIRFGSPQIGFAERTIVVPAN
jgi:hypothetical protein